MSEAIMIKDAVCSFCGCLCDDINVEVEDGKDQAGQACLPPGLQQNHGPRSNAKPHDSQRRRAGGVELPGSIRPCRRDPPGCGQTPPLRLGIHVMRGSKKGILLAEEVGGVLDSTATVCHGPSVIGIEEKGLPGATLGQVKNRADTIVFWGCNPAEAHPRHSLRYSSNSCGKFTPEGREGRKIIVVDVRETRTSKNADKFIRISPAPIMR